MRKFDINLFKNHKDKYFKNNIHLIIGKEGCGKTFLIKDILYNHQFIPEGKIIINKITDEEKYKQIIPEEFIKKEYNMQATFDFMKRQKEKRKYIVKKEEFDYQQKKLNKEQGLKENKENEEIFDNRAFLILDDCLNDKKYYKDKIIREIYMNGRIWGIFNIISSSCILEIRPPLSGNIDFVFIFKEELEKNKKLIYKNYIELYFSDMKIIDSLGNKVKFNMNYNYFEQIINSLNEYECLVLNYSVPSMKLEDNISWYKAENHEKFTMCNINNFIKNNKIMRTFI